MTLIGNTLLFVDTGFFKNYKPKDNSYTTLFKYSVEGSITLCTSDLCLEEWRSQKAEQLKNLLRDNDHKIENLRGNNYFSKILLPEKAAYDDLKDPVILKEKMQRIIDDFIKEHDIARYPLKEEHIDPTWDSYFQGNPPYNDRKRTHDIPDAWIYECAKDVLDTPEYQSLVNKFCIGSDGPMLGHLEDLSFVPITIGDLISKLREEEIGVNTQDESIVNEVTSANIEKVFPPNDQEPLDILLSKAISDTAKEIYLRLLGYVVPLDTPTHEFLIDTIAVRGFDRKLTEACAVILSDKTNPYIKDTGTHYLAGNSDICTAASDRLTSEIIDMLEKG